MLPDECLAKLVDKYGLSTKDAKTLMVLDNGDRLDYFYDVIHHLFGDDEHAPAANQTLCKKASNWFVPWQPCT